MVVLLVRSRLLVLLVLLMLLLHPARIGCSPHPTPPCGAGVYGVFSLTGEEHPEAGKNPYNTLIMITDQVGTILPVRGLYRFCIIMPVAHGWPPQIMPGAFFLSCLNYCLICLALSNADAACFCQQKCAAAAA
jgi:hypothetical protein